ncbi:MAG: iron-containing alcohol dehydrogenase [Bacteroidales bacterium]|nr:iron-containing alcohol dehydrogenase [Bacteroidales bacterium]
MENFTAYNPVKVVFGKNAINKLGISVLPYSKKVMLVYGGGSIKKNGIYRQVIAQLKENNIEYIEFSGIKPNPVHDSVELAVELAKRESVGLILAVGGGSVIDSAKLIALCAIGNFDVWDVMKGRVKPKEALPLFTVLTLAATGTEMNQFAVLQNSFTQEKIGYGNSLIFPKISFLDPEFTMSVSSEYTSYGIADIAAHCLEAYFGNGDSPLTDKFIFSILKELIEVGPKLLNNLTDYDLRARMLWASTAALNGITVFGKVSGDWGVHDIGHIISLLYDTAHGATLSVSYPAWLKTKKDEISEKLLLLGKEVFNSPNEDETIEALENFFKLIKCPVRISELHLPENYEIEIIEKFRRNKVSGYFYSLNDEDYYKLLINMK